MVRVACDPRSPSLCFESPHRTTWGTQFVCHTAGIPLHHRISSSSSVRGEAGMGLITSYTGAWCLWNTYTTTANRFLFIYFLICLESMKSPLKHKDIFFLCQFPSQLLAGILPCLAEENPTRLCGIWLKALAFSKTKQTRYWNPVLQTGRTVWPHFFWYAWSTEIL